VSALEEEGLDQGKLSKKAKKKMSKEMDMKHGAREQ